MEQSGREYERAIAYIQSLISSHRIEIGDKLPSEREISQELCLSRNSTREALRMLENMGVLESRQGSGNYLCGYMTQSFKNAFDMMILLQETNREDICRFRRSMEKAVYDLAYQRRMDSPYIPKMEEVLQSFPDAELERQVKLDKEFHYLLVQAAENQLLRMMMDAISDIYQDWVGDVLRMMPPGGMQELHQAHTEILESLLLGKKNLGIRAIDAHYNIIDRMSVLQNNSNRGL